ncbi:hypothetical protein FSP39_005703 [Pinctada imbricata]|uniref:Uncharacterized protein n=1 Tax=Pinctada imbricata TaxID=66713 RepID=A0AA88Y7H9_PINIB|nr:hypothetical protein FSP39_005703 [Pinctada imbricata]
MPKLKVSKKETSRYRASKISVQDNRPSAVALGSGLAICLLVIPLALIVISDIPLLIRHMRSGTTS